MTTYVKDISIVGGIATTEGTLSGLLTLYGTTNGSKLCIQVGYGFNSPKHYVGHVNYKIGEADKAWEKACLKLEAEPVYDKNGNVTPRTL